MDSSLADSCELLVGRTSEQACLVEFIDAIGGRERVSARVLTGEAGIGKSMLWRFGVERSRTAGLAVLACRAAVCDRLRPATTLLELFGSIECDPQVTSPHTDHFERARATLSALRDLAAISPVLIAIDDLQCVDSVSSHALRYALRRLDGALVGVLATVEENHEDPDAQAAIENTLGIDGVQRLPVGPLTSAELRMVLERSVGAISRPELVRLHDITGGNPMFALQIVHCPSQGPPTSVTDAFSAKLDAAPATAAPLLRLLSVAGALHVDFARELLKETDVAAAVGVVEELGLVEVGDDLIVRFAHPLLAMASVDRLVPCDQRELHARLADHVGDVDERARHLARSTVESDDAIAAELEQAARRAERRGASDLAADLAAHARRVTPPTTVEELGRRTLLEVSNRAAAGEPSRAIQLLDELLVQTTSTSVRIEATTQRAFLDFDDSERFLGDALDDAGDDQLHRGRVLDLLAWQAGTYRGQLERGIDLGARALSIGRHLNDDELIMLAAATLSTTSLFAGRPRPELMDEAVAIAGRVSQPRLGRWPGVFLARHCLWGGQLSEARTLFERAQEMSISSGSEFQRPYRLFDLAMLELAAGDPGRAAILSDDGLEAARDAGNAHAAAWLRQPQGLARAWLGNTEEACGAADALIEWASAHDEPPRAVSGLRIRGLVHLAANDAESALTVFLAAVDILDDLGFVHPGVTWVLFDAIDAACSIDDAATCRSLGGRLREQADRLKSPLIDALATAGEGCALVGGDDELAVKRLVEASGSLAGLGYLADAGRVDVMLGRALLALGDRRAASDVFARAERVFDVMGAAPWAQLAMSRSGGSGVRSTDRDLTDTEHHVIDLVAQGMRNREIAATLFLSVSSVEAYLTKIYRTLGVRSRTELLGNQRGQSTGAA